AGLAVAKLDGPLGFALPEDGFGYALNGDRPGLGGVGDVELQRDLAIDVDLRRHVDRDADILVVELRLHADAGDARSDACVIRAGGDGNPRSDLERGILAVGRAD